MRYQRLLIGVGILMAGCLAACSPKETIPGVPAHETAGFQAIQKNDLVQNLTYVASDELGGRFSMQPGDMKTEAWITDQFAKAGLSPAATDANGQLSYIQPVPLIEFVSDADESSLSLVRDSKTTVWHRPEMTGGYKQAVDISAPVVFAGFGITAPELNYDDYANIDAKGKIVLIFDHEPQEADPQSIFNGSGNTRYATDRVKVMNAQVHGALAVVVVAEPNRKHITNAERRARLATGVGRVHPLPSQAIAEDSISIPSVTVLDSVATEIFASTGGALSDAQTAIDKDLQPQSRDIPGAALTVHLRNRSERRGVSNNIAGLLPGSDPTLAAETILISGHHDHDGMSECDDPNTPPVSVPADPHPCPQIWRGADDNGSGTVGVVELAKAFGANKAKPKRSILFAVFAAEERGLLGSYYMAAHPLRPLGTTRAQINFDMIGRDEAPSPQTDGLIEIPQDTNNRLNLVGALYSPDYSKTVKDANAAVGLALDDRFDHESTLNVFFRSDQFPFVLHNIPAFWWFTGFHPDYHHTTDTVDKIDFDKMVKILQLAYLSAWRFGSDTAVPKFVSTPAAEKQRP